MTKVRTEHTSTMGSSSSTGELLGAIHERWQYGGSRHAEVTHFAEQYRRYVTMLPHYVNAVAAEISSGLTRARLNELVELLTGDPSDIELYDAFLDSIGGRSDAGSTLDTRQLVQAYGDALLGGSSASLGALAESEHITRDIARLMASTCRSSERLAHADTTYWDCLLAEPGFTAPILVERAAEDGRLAMVDAWDHFLLQYRTGVFVIAA
jgi:hypothetical protein